MMVQIMPPAYRSFRPALDQIPNNCFCQSSNRNHSHALPAGLPTRPNWTRFAVELDGASFSHPSMSSGVSSFRGSQETTGCTHARGQFTHDHG